MGLALVFITVVGIYVFDVYRNIDSTTNEIYEPVDEEVEQVRSSSADLNSKEPISILLLGVDTGDLGRTERGRSDTMMVVTVNPNTKKSTITSIPRDTYTEIVGYGTSDKINHAYAFGGNSMAINSVQNLLDIPIDYYVTVNMAGIQEIVNAVGGVDVVSPLTFSQDGYTFYQGEVNHLDGNAALAFARMRYEDPEGDTGRQARQRIIIEGVVNKVTSASTLVNYQNILGSLSNNVQTNFQMKDYLALQGNDYLAAARNITSEQMGGSGGIGDDGIYYNWLSEDELYRVQSLLQSELELD
ncbi:transcriptional regulator [Jeotgalibaca porci]|uniref:Transcriptional regulator n=2 Tax=Jeotgalibaca porci TaxID=1868793 RepID=A0A6G7WKA0_9LACT|nr:transcriptional regulator [Jeotgalibaca porci]